MYLRSRIVKILYHHNPCTHICPVCALVLLLEGFFRTLHKKVHKNQLLALSISKPSITQKYWLCGLYFNNPNNSINNNRILNVALIIII